MSKADEYAEALRQLEQLHKDGKLDTAAYEKRKKALQREAPPPPSAASQEKRRIIDEDLADGRIGKTEHAAKIRELDASDAAAASTARTMKFGCLGVLALMVVLTIGAVSCFNRVANQPPSESQYRNAAIVECEAAVKAMLKSPSTAKFPNSTATRTSDAGRVYLVKGSVDAQNSFGATIRNTFDCTATHYGDERQFTARVTRLG